tara:strand:- start:118 stop:1779 length:1662 start_codon:yes stop_codon:yes gene_type:complete
MATTFTSNYQIKLIGTGLEAGTWGTSNNENFKRVEQALGGSSLSFNIAVPGAPSTYDSGTETLTWLVGNNIDAAEAGSDGRNKFVVFTDSGDLAADQIVNIRGDTSASLTDRIYFVKNSLTASRKITFNAGGTGTDLYVLENGCSAVIYSNAAATEVGNLLDTLQLAGLNFPAASDIDISGTTTNALRIKSPAETYFNIKSAADVADSLVTLRAGETRIDSATLTTGSGTADSIVTSSGNHNLTLQTGNSSTGSITIVDNANEDILLKNHGTGKVMVGSSSNDATITSSGAHNLKLETNDGTNSGVIEITDGAAGAITITPDAGGAGGSVVMSKVDIAGGEIDGTVIGAHSAAAITGAAIAGTTITGSSTVTGADVVATQKLNCSTNNTGVTMKDTGGTNANVLRLNASDKLLVGETTDVDGIKLQSSADSFVVNHGGGDLDILHMGTSGTVYKADGTTAGVDSPSAALGSNKQGGFAVGEMYFYFDTVLVGSGGLAVDLSGSFSVIYTVMVTAGDAAHAAQASVDGSVVTTINLDDASTGNKLISYLAIGKS